MTTQDLDGKQVKIVLIHNDANDLVIEFSKTHALFKKKKSKMLHILKLSDFDQIKEEMDRDKIKPIDLKTGQIDLTMLLDQSLSPIHEPVYLSQLSS